MKNLLLWQWGPKQQLGLGAAFGIVLGLVLLALIGWDLSRGPGGGYTPPAWYGGSHWVPTAQQICTEGGKPVIDPEAIYRTNASFMRRCWESWPAPEPVDCDGSPAPAGVVRWHSCAEPRLDPSGLISSPCANPADADPILLRRGATYLNLGDDGQIDSADIYILLDDCDPQDETCVRLDPDSCQPMHEAGHARGMLSPIPGQDSHSSLPRSLMYAECPRDLGPRAWIWLDRCEGGDWPW